MNEKTAPNLVIDDVTKITATELRTHTRSILERAKFQGEHFVVYTHGQAMAVVVGVGEIEGLQELLARKNDDTLETAGAD